HRTKNRITKSIQGVITITDEILRIEKNEMKIMPSRTFREGFMGRTLEDGLQVLIEDYPGIIPGRQIAPGSGEPPRFMLLCREMSVGGWALDFLLVDQFGIPTLLEAKLIENPESRRAVVGQIIEYAANAADNWLNGKLFEKASSYYTKKGLDLDEALKQFTGNEDLTVDDFFELVEQNLNQGKMRLIIASDNLRPEVRKIIEYLNAETRNIEVLGLEISFYGDDESAVLVPTVVGQSQIVAAKKRGAEKTTKWDYPILIEELDKLDNPVIAERLKEIASWATKVDFYMPVVSKEPAFAVRSKHGPRLFTFSTTGIYCYLTPKHHGDSITERDNFVLKIKELPIFNYTANDLQAKEGRNAPGTIESLTGKEFVRFLEILQEISS
ncbi:MAG: hypothetical protein U1E11_06415, partial [Dethiobacteria bacterium]|nr:hypothetical protein [Dethiobacteria bacterium]